MSRRAGSPNYAATRRIDIRTATCRACGETFDYLLSGGKPERRYCSVRCHGLARTLAAQATRRSDRTREKA